MTVEGCWGRRPGKRMRAGFFQMSGRTHECPVLVMRSNDKCACLLAFWCLAMNLARVPLFSELGRNQEASGAARWRDIAECSAGVAPPVPWWCGRNGCCNNPQQRGNVSRGQTAQIATATAERSEPPRQAQRLRGELVTLELLYVVGVCVNRIGKQRTSYCAWTK